MRSKWANKSLKELGVQLIDCVHKTPSAQTHGIPYIGIPQMKNGELDFEASPRLISEADYKLWTEKVNPQRGDIVLSRRCNPGETAYVSDNTKFALGQNLVLLRTTGNLIKSEYLRWVVNSTYWWDEVEKYKNPGAIFDSLKCCDIPNFKIPTPPLHIQDKISYILGSLTDKINLNNKYNHTLEQMSQTLFKSWFVDFDPVIDNALDAGNPIPEALQTRAKLRQKVRNSADFKPLPAEIRSLFPSEFEETELGWVPKGWEIGKLQDLLILQRGFDLPSTQRNIGLHPIIAASGYNGTHDIAMVKAPGIVTGRSGVLGNVFLILEDFWPLNTTLWVKELKHATPCYGYELLKMIDFSSFNGGSAVPTLNRNHIHNLDYLLPPRNLIEKFELFSMSLYRQVHEFKKQAQTLTALRDTLLPKLISGELSLEDLPDLSTDTEAA
ncbi:restriction endonuclease subunit S [Escherichia coli]